MLINIDPNLLKPEVSVLIVTATGVEHQEMLSRLEPLPSQEDVLTIYNGNQTYDIGLFGIYGVVLVQAEMGSVSANGSLVTTLNAIHLWEPKAIIMVGIAFGIDDEKQKIGDVLISSHIIPYEIGKEGPEGFQYRSPLPIANTLLVNRAREVRDWNYKIEGKKVKVFLGPLLTGEKVIDNLDFRNKLKNVYRNTIGGEMESAGVFAASNDAGIPWIIIKGICDFADGLKGKNKELNQEIAIKTSVSFTLHFLSNGYAFNELGFKPLISFRGDVQTSENVLISSLINFLDSYNPSDEKSVAEQLRVSAREISQTDVDRDLRKTATTIIQLVPNTTLEIFETRIKICWDGFNEVLASTDGYLPNEIENSTIAVMRCVCRELRRLVTLNGGLPPNSTFSAWWENYKCQA